METKFTKGEWNKTLIDLADFGIAAISNESKVIAQCNLSSELTDEIKANAALISSAPNMFNSIVKLQEWSKKYPPGRIYSYGEAATIERELTEIVEEQLKAIQKAEPSVSF